MCKKCEARTVAVDFLEGMDEAARERTTSRLSHMAEKFGITREAAAVFSLEFAVAIVWGHDLSDSPTDDELTAEVLALGRMMLGEPVCASYFAEVAKDPWHKIVALAINALRESGRVADPVSVAAMTVVPAYCAEDPLPLLAEMADLALRDGASLH